MELVVVVVVFGRCRVSFVLAITVFQKRPLMTFLHKIQIRLQQFVEHVDRVETVLEQTIEVGDGILLLELGQIRQEPVHDFFVRGRFLVLRRNDVYGATIVLVVAGLYRIESTSVLRRLRIRSRSESTIVPILHHRRSPLELRHGHPRNVKVLAFVFLPPAASSSIRSPLPRERRRRSLCCCFRLGGPAYFNVRHVVDARHGRRGDIVVILDVLLLWRYVAAALEFGSAEVGGDHVDVGSERTRRVQE
mmetsp:Transcript_3860/g.7349  ORF Transcript_3860/g.7349 Transcript_3860/m.7349 type:complete len:248 (-) Transcript_3860:46-789(-)